MAKKLIEVALPLDEINKACGREKSIRHGHPATLHLWWARRPLAAARAVLFAQTIDDPSEHVELFPTAEDQDKERQRLLKLIIELVQWESTIDPNVMGRAREEIWKSWRATCARCGKNAVQGLFDPSRLPDFYDPFAGGGALPLEAQRLGFQPHASDLNPVAVLINKAMIEIPGRFAGLSAINPESDGKTSLLQTRWHNAQGLAEDVRFYGHRLSVKAKERIGQSYPPIRVTKKLAVDRPDLRPFIGQDLTVIAWLWARTVRSPNPAFKEVEVPLAATFMLSTKAGKEAYVQPVIGKADYNFVVKLGRPENRAAAEAGTKAGRGGNFRCLMSNTPITPQYIYDEANAGRMGKRLMSIVVEIGRGRTYLSPQNVIEGAHEPAVQGPDLAMPENPRWFSPPLYGLKTYGELFTTRQLLTLTTLSDLIQELHEEIKGDGSKSELPNDQRSIEEGGKGAVAYADAVSVFLAFAVCKLANIGSSLTSWMNDRGALRETFSRQAVPMVWDFAEANPLATTGGSLGTVLDKIAMVIKLLPATPQGYAYQADAASTGEAVGRVVSTDPPYYDNIGYGDLSDFFYVWLRQSLRSCFPKLFATLAVPKSDELVATPYRHGGTKNAERFFLTGMTRALQNLADLAHPAFPITIYYAFKQSETAANGSASTGWETFLEAVIRAGFAISGTWPMRTEGAGRIVARETNALASSIVLVCRQRSSSAPATTRRQFLAALKVELPESLRRLQQSSIAPADLAQAAIGPGMAIFTRYSNILDAEGKPVPVREALSLINRALDEVLTEQEGDFDADSRWAVTWFEQHGFAEGEFGVAEQLSKSKNTSVEGLADAKIVQSKRGKVRLMKPVELPVDWDPATDPRLTAWEMVHQLIRALDSGGEAAAASLVAKLGTKAEIARELAYRLYMIAERKKRPAEALGV